MNASGRRQRQAKNGYSHWAPRQRPNYKRRDLETSRRHQEKVLKGERERAQRGKK